MVPRSLHCGSGCQLILRPGISTPVQLFCLHVLLRTPYTSWQAVFVASSRAAEKIAHALRNHRLVAEQAGSCMSGSRKQLTYLLQTEVSVSPSKSNVLIACGDDGEDLPTTDLELQSLDREQPAAGPPNRR